MELQGVDAVYLRLGEGRVELVSPLAADTPVGRFLAKRVRGCITLPSRWTTSGLPWASSSHRAPT